MTSLNCVKCEGHLFQLVEHVPIGAVDKILFVQCAACGTPVGVLPEFDSAAILKKRETGIEELKGQVSEIDGGLRRIVEFLQQG
jgi:hypothetical protein